MPLSRDSFCKLFPDYFTKMADFFMQDISCTNKPFIVVSSLPMKYTTISILEIDAYCMTIYATLKIQFLQILNKLF